MQHDKLTEAVNLLIASPQYAVLANEMTAIIENWDRKHVVYSGEFACLNSLVDVGVQNRAAFERLLSMVRERRQTQPHTRRIDYQREIMRERRARVAKGLLIYEAAKGKVSGEKRKQIAAALQKRWSEQRTAYLAARRGLNWQDRNSASADFWAKIDQELDTRLAAARNQASN